jgi:hypothetical protein
MHGTPVVYFELPFCSPVPRERAHSSQSQEHWPGVYQKGDPAYAKLLQDTLRAFETHLRQKGWTKTTYIVFFNKTDEPTALSEYETIRELGNWVREAEVPLFRFKVDIGHFADCWKRVPQFKSIRGMFAFMDPAVSFWCGNGGLYDVEEAVEEMKRGRLAYYYGTNLPPGQGNTFLDGEALGPRVWPLIAARYELTGGEVWHFMHHYKDAWENKPTDAGRQYFGYAQFVYPEQGLGVDFGEPIASIRLKGFRRGQQDAEYFWLARQGPGKAEAEQMLERLIPEALDKAMAKYPKEHPGAWPHDPAEFEKVRVAVGRLVEKQGQGPTSRP